MNARVSVVIPSRLATPSADAAGPWFVERALDCLRGQSALKQGAAIQALVAVDAGQGQRAHARLGEKAVVIESAGRSQAAALNAGLRAAAGDVIAILEDDDLWSPEFLTLALTALAQHDFVSSTQLEVNDQGHVLAINDFATPSGWVMSRSTLQQVGLLDEGYRWHLDNEWLGRLGESGLRRAHLVEATAPVLPELIARSGRELRYLVSFGGPQVALIRHGSPWPLIVRAVHAGSGMGQIARDAGKKAESEAEYQRLRARFGHLPW